MKILYYAHFSPVGYESQGGGAISVWETIKILSLEASTQVLVAYRPSDDVAEHPEWAKDEARMKLFPVHSPKELVGVLQSTQPEVFHGVDVFCEDGIKYCKSNNIKTVFDVRSVSCWPTKLVHKMRPPFSKNWRVFFHNRVERKVAALADCVIRPSEAAVKTAIENYGLNPSAVKRVYNTVDTDLYHPSFKKHDRLKIVNAGRIAFDRHFKMLIEIYCELKKLWPELTLDIAGDGHQKAELEQWVKDVDIKGVTFHGSLDRAQLAEFYRLGDVLVNTSAMESFGNVVAEGMASGLPVVCFEVGSLPELMDEGITGYLNTFGDVNAHIAATRGLLEEPSKRRQMGEAGVARMKKLFSEERKKNTLLELYHELVFTK